MARTNPGLGAGYWAGEVGRGLLAGAAGTVAMTAVSTLEMKLTGRGPSNTPAEAAKKVLHVETPEEDGRLSNAVHFGYGTALGALRGGLGALGLRGALGGAVHFAAVWGAALTLLPAMGLSPPPQRWSGKTLALDALHHLVYAAVTDLVFESLGGRRERRIRLPRGTELIVRRPRF